MYCLDTSFLIDLFFSAPKAVQMHEMIKDSLLFTSTITIFELMRAPSTTRQDIEEIRDIFSSLQILDFDERAAEESAIIDKQLTKKGKKINLGDLLIAGIAKSNNLIIVTSDNDFKKIPGLKVESY